jgi:hypothetical protein
MNRRTIVLLGGFVLALSTPAWGQAKKPVRVGVGTSAPPAQPIVVNTTGLPATSNTTTQPAPSQSPGAPAQVAQIIYYPTVILADGRVLANFGTGHGYEEVLRQCPQLTGTLPPNATIAPCWSVDAYGNYRVMQRR